MRLLFIVNSAFFGGAEISILQLIRSLGTRKYEVFLALPPDHKFPTENLGNVHIIELPFAWFTFSYNPTKIFQYCFSLVYCSLKIYGLVKRLGIDIIYSNSIKSHVYGSLVKLFSKKKSIWHVRDNIKINYIHNVLAKYTDKVICISDFVYNQIKNSSSTATMIYNGIDTEFYDVATSAGRNRDTAVKTVTLVSQITRWKNIEDFIHLAEEILRSNRNVRFIIAGDSLSKTDECYKDEILTMINQRKLNKHIAVLGWVKDIRNIYSQTDVLVHTAINEPFGRVVAEAMSMEVPVIAYRCGGPSEIILDGVTGYLVEIGNYRAMAQKLVLLLGSPVDVIKFGENGRKRIQSEFNLDDHVRSVESLLHDV